MSSTSPLRRVLITGANGYIAVQTVARFLASGWAVRGTVRNLESATSRELSTHFAAEQSRGTFELVTVPDIKAPGAFDTAVRGVSAVAHLATPVVFDSGDVEYIMGTATGGTLGILESALREKNEGEGALESFILMSSIAAIRSRSVPPPVTFTEEHWNDDAVKQVKELGDKAFGHLIYSASKVASERAFWDWVADKKPGFAATALNPSWVAGPPLYLPNAGPAGISDTNKFVYTLLSGGECPPGPGPAYGTHVDVRDVARMVEWAASHPSVASGQRYIVGGNGNIGSPQAAADILREAYPDRRDIIKEGTPGAGYLPGWKEDPSGARVDSTKALKATGQAWLPYDKIVLDTAKMFEALL